MTYKDQTIAVAVHAAVIAIVLHYCPVTAESEDPLHDIMTVCDGASASFSWPCNFQYDLTKTMTLVFKGLDGKSHLLATITGNGSVTVSKEFSSRVRPRGTSGVHMDGVGILDSGVYVTTAEFNNGTVVDRHFTLNVHMPPLLKQNALTASITNTSQGCQTITCGHIIFYGFPPVSLDWNTPQRSQRHEATDGESAVHGCPLLPGNYTCRLTGPALTCGKLPEMSVMASVVIPIPAGMAKEVAAKAAKAEQLELVLMIVVPIASVMLPLVILGLWVLSHLLSGRSSSNSKVDEEAAGWMNGRQRLVELSSGVLTQLTLRGFSAASHSNQSSPGPSSPVTSPETVPLTSSPDDEEEDEEENGGDNKKGGETLMSEAKEGEGEEAESDTELLDDIDADVTTPLMDSDSSAQIHFVDEADETPL
ncbi:uncharacterized protein [Littorina saxatilis]|uniref:uncharacterized protein isoform X2 n=1 Tax=Littorina saxatilis TaxID=31220 RepID=UPI0038B69F62